MGLPSILALGLILGMRHATDTDHVVAVTTIVSRERTRRGALWIGALWGIGHTATVLLVGGAIVVFGVAIPPHLGLSLELCAAVLLVVLGCTNVIGAVRRLDEAHAHGVAPGGAGPAGGRFAVRRYSRSLLVGVVHGLAGSAAVALLVLTTLRDPASGVLYLAVFGLGTVLGMMALTLAMALPVVAVARRFASFEAVVARVTGVISIVFGVMLTYQIGFVDGLFGEHPSWTPH